VAVNGGAGGGEVVARGVGRGGLLGGRKMRMETPKRGGGGGDRRHKKRHEEALPCHVTTISVPRLIKVGSSPQTTPSVRY
jgi:hypothetical protein